MYECGLTSSPRLSGTLSSEVDTDAHKLSKQLDDRYSNLTIEKMHRQDKCKWRFSGYTIEGPDNLDKQ